VKTGSVTNCVLHWRNGVLKVRQDYFLLRSTFLSFLSFSFFLSFLLSSLFLFLALFTQPGIILKKLSAHFHIVVCRKNPACRTALATLHLWVATVICDLVSMD